MKAIARDELRHASIAWQLAAWLAPRLTSQERAQVDVERAAAVVELETELNDAPPEAIREALGLPARAEAQSLLRSMRAEVWLAPVEAAA